MWLKLGLCVLFVIYCVVLYGLVVCGVVVFVIVRVFLCNVCVLIRI